MPASVQILASVGLLDNRYILLALAAELGVIMFVIFTEAGNWLFGTAAIGVEVWLLALAGAATMWLLEEMRKAWLRRQMLRAGVLRPAACSG